MPSHYAAEFPAKVDLHVLSAVSRFSGTDDTRAYLIGVRVEIGPRDVVYVATDGKRLIAIRQEKMKDDPDNDLTGRFTIPTTHCRAFKLKKDQDPIADLYGDNERLTIKKNDVEVTFTPLQDGEFIGRWVDWRHIIPRPARTAEAGQFDHAQLATFQKFADDMPGGYYPYVIHNGRDGGALIRFSNMDAIGVVVPVKIDDLRETPLPSWARTEDFRSWDRYERHREPYEPANDQAENLGDAVDDLVDRLRAKQEAPTDAAAAARASEMEIKTEAPSSGVPGDDVAASHQAEALGGGEVAQDAGEGTGSAEQRENVEGLQDIQRLEAGEGEPIDAAGGEGGDGETTAEAEAKPKRRGRRSTEQRVADNARATEAGRML